MDLKDDDMEEVSGSKTFTKQTDSKELTVSQSTSPRSPLKISDTQKSKEEAKSTNQEETSSVPSM